MLCFIRKKKDPRRTPDVVVILDRFRVVKRIRDIDLDSGTNEETVDLFLTK